MTALLLTICCLFNNTAPEEYVIVLNNGKKIIATVISKSKTSLTYKRKGVTLSLNLNQIRSMKKRVASASKIKEAAAKKAADKKAEEVKASTEIENDIKKLIVKAREGDDEDLDLLIKTAANNLATVLKKSIKVANDKDADFIFLILKKCSIDGGHDDLWMWFLSFAKGKVLEEACAYLEADKKIFKSSQLLIMALMHSRKDDSKIIKESAKKLLAKINFNEAKKEDVKKIKEIIFSRTKVGPDSNRVFAAKMIFKHFSDLSRSEWEGLITSDSLDLRMVSISEANGKRYKEIAKAKVVKLYINSSNINEKVLILKYLSRLKSFFENEDKVFFKALFKDLNLDKALKGNQRTLRSLAFHRLKADSGKEFPLRSNEWVVFLADK